MHTHPRAKLGPAGRLALIVAIANGMTQKAAAAAFCVSPTTAHRWWHRRLGASAAELASGSWLLDRSSRPHTSCGCWTRSRRSGSARRGEPAVDRDWSPAPPVTRTRRSGRYSTGTASRGGPDSHERTPTARNGVPGRPAAHGNSPLRAVSAPWSRRHRDRSQRSRNWMAPEARVSTTSLTRSSMTTRGSPTSSCSKMSAPRPTHGRARARRSCGASRSCVHGGTRARLCRARDRHHLALGDTHLDTPPEQSSGPTSSRWYRS